MSEWERSIQEFNSALKSESNFLGDSDIEEDLDITTEQVAQVANELKSATIHSHTDDHDHDHESDEEDEGNGPTDEQLEDILGPLAVKDPSTRKVAVDIFKSGYREGKQQGDELVMQSSFDEAFTRVMVLGRLAGRLYALATAFRSSPESPLAPSDVGFVASLLLSELPYLSSVLRRQDDLEASPPQDAPQEAILTEGAIKTALEAELMTGLPSDVEATLRNLLSAWPALYTCPPLRREFDTLQKLLVQP